MTNLFLTLITLVFGAVVVIYLYIKAAREESDDPERDKMTFNKILERIKIELADAVKDDTFYGVAGSDFEAAFNRKSLVVKAMRNCSYGIDKYKTIVMGLIKNVIGSICVTVEELCEIVDFNATFLESRIKFEIILYFYKKDYGKDALTKLINEYKLDRVRYDDDAPDEPCYFVTQEDINSIYDEKNYKLTQNQMLDIITILIYQKYKGFGIIDTIREMNIDGLNGGASGSILSSLLNNGKADVMTAARSVWVHFEGKQIHFRFLTFGSEEEVRRIAQLLGRYGKSSPITEMVGYKVSTMYDKSRVLILRPPASEYWCFFIRKFVLPEVNLKFLLQPKDKLTGQPLISNPEIVMDLVKFMMKGQLTNVITGRQGTGKTTNMMAWIKYIDPRLTIRVLEMVFELYLRELYPKRRNIISVQETEYVTPQALQDALKKSDGQVTLIGEIATDIVASRFIQNTQISSPFSVASHHAMTPPGLMRGLGNSHSAASGIPTNIALEQVVEAVPMNSHLNIRYDGVRYFEHFTEIIPVLQKNEYPNIDESTMKALFKSHFEVQRLYAIQQTNKETFRTNTILKFDIENGKYIPVNWFSEERTQHMLDRMLTASDREDFARFADKYWGNDSYKSA